MPTLREHTRRALSRTEPTASEAERELAEILDRADARRRTRARAAWILAPVTVAVVIAAIVLGRAKRPPDAPPAVALGGVHLYLHVEGESLDQAVTLDLATPGEH